MSRDVIKTRNDELTVVCTTFEGLDDGRVELRGLSDEREGVGVNLHRSGKESGEHAG